jgi:regulator of protease activity HflC (stomatin/prohibitin superfamily)
MDRRKFLPFVVLGVIGLFVVLMFANSIFLTIQPGEKGVLFRRFGGGLDKENVYSQGFHIIAPWNKMFIYDVRIQESLATMEVLSKNGLTIKCELSYRFHPEADQIGFLHDNIGFDYHQRIIVPEVRSATREVIGKYLPEELYSSKREAIQDEIYQRTSSAIAENHLDMDAVLIREVVLPATLQDAIERKLRQEQESLEYEFRITKAEQEAERQRIEAEGKARANTIISASLTDKILQEKGIDATKELAQSQNAKVVVIGSGDSGLPLILGNN